MIAKSREKIATENQIKLNQLDIIDHYNIRIYWY